MKKDLHSIVENLHNKLKNYDFEIHKEIKISKSLTVMFFGNNPNNCYFCIYKNGKQKFLYGIEYGVKWESFIFTDSKTDKFYFNNLFWYDYRIDENKNFIFCTSYGIHSKIIDTKSKFKNLESITIRYFEKESFVNIYGKNISDWYSVNYKTDRVKKLNKQFKGR